MAVRAGFITKDLQSNVDKYIEAYRLMKEYEKLAKKLREDIEAEMDERSLFSVEGSVDGEVNIVHGERAVTTARYTTYSPRLLKDLPVEVANECMKVVVDKEAVELLIKQGKIRKSKSEKYKTLQPTRSFKTKV